MKAMSDRGIRRGGARCALFGGDARRGARRRDAEVEPRARAGAGSGDEDDEVGALNEMTDASRLAALQLVTQGKTYDLGLPYDRYSFKWPGHSPGEIISFRTPEGVARQKDLPFTTAREAATPGTRAGTATPCS